MLKVTVLTTGLIFVQCSKAPGDNVNARTSLDNSQDLSVEKIRQQSASSAQEAIRSESEQTTSGASQDSSDIDAKQSADDEQAFSKADIPVPTAGVNLTFDNAVPRCGFEGSGRSLKCQPAVMQENGELVAPTSIDENLEVSWNLNAYLDEFETDEIDCAFEDISFIISCLSSEDFDGDSVTIEMTVLDTVTSQERVVPTSLKKSFKKIIRMLAP